MELSECLKIPLGHPLRDRCVNSCVYDSCQGFINYIESFRLGYSYKSYIFMIYGNGKNDVDIWVTLPSEKLNNYVYYLDMERVIPLFGVTLGLLLLAFFSSYKRRRIAAQNIVLG